MGRISALTENILAFDRDARNSDNALHIAVLDELGANLSEHQKNILRSYSFESVRRTRQKLNELGKYLPDDPVIRERRMKSLEIQQSIPITKPGKIDDRIDSVPHAIPWRDEE